MVRGTFKTKGKIVKSDTLEEKNSSLKVPASRGRIRTSRDNRHLEEGIRTSREFPRRASGPREQMGSSSARVKHLEEGISSFESRLQCKAKEGPCPRAYKYVQRIQDPLSWEGMHTLYDSRSKGHISTLCSIRLSMDLPSRVQRNEDLLVEYEWKLSCHGPLH